MKKIIYSILIIFATIVSCEQEEFTGSGLESLRDFTLTPIPNSKIALNSLSPEGTIVVSWQQARSGFKSPVTYTWMFDEKGGNFSSPILSLPSDDEGKATLITFTNEQLEEALATAGVAAGAEIDGIWAVKATNGDVTKVSPSNVLTIQRYSEAIMTFGLSEPNNDATVFLKESMTNDEISIIWEETVSGIGSAVKYKWIADEPDGDFSSPVLSIDSDNNGTENSLTMTHQDWETALANLGVEAQSKINLKWTVEATAGEVKQTADQAFNISLVRWGTKVRFVITEVPSIMPSGKDIFVAGEFDFLGNGSSNWQTPGSNPALKLTKNTNDNTYYIDLNVPKGTSFQYKFALATTTNPTWDNGEQKFNDTEDDCVGIDNRQFAFDGTQQVVDHEVISWEKFCPFDVVPVTFELKGYPPIPNGYDVYLAGSFANIGDFGSWNEPGSNPEFKLTKGDDNVYRKTFQVLKSQADAEVSYKYFLVPQGGTSWSHGEQSFSVDGCQGLHGGPEGSDRKFQYSTGDGLEKFVESNVVTWEGFCFEDDAPRARIEVTVPGAVPDGKDVYITGDLKFTGADNFESVWKMPGTNPALRMRPVDGQANKYEIYLPLEQGTEVKFKFFLATTANPGWGNGEQKANGDSSGCEGAPDRSFTFDGSNEFTGVVYSWEGYCPL